MKYVEIIVTAHLIGKEFKDSFLVEINNTILFQTFELSNAIQFLKDNNLYNDYILSCEG